MATGAAHEAAITTQEMEHGLMSRAFSQAQQFVCGLRGHDALLHFETGRLSLQCTSCGYETPGWDLKKTVEPPAQRVAKPRLVRLPMIRERRVA